MDSKVNICYRFKDVFAFLSQHKYSIPDDAILHLLSDVVNTELRNKKSIDESDVIQFLCDVADTIDDQNDGIINLALDITGWLGSVDDYFTHYQPCLTIYIRTVWNKISLDNVSVASAFFNCLNCLTGHKKGVEWLINENEDIHKDWLKILESGSSIFLQKAVINYITRLCTAQGSESHQITVNQIINEDVLPVIRKYKMGLKAPEKAKMYSRPYILSLLQLIEGLCSSKLICEMMVPTTLVEDLSSIILLGEKVHADASMAVIKNVYCRGNDVVGPSIELLIHQLLMKGDVMKAQAVSLLRFREENPEDCQMRELFLLPIKCVLNLLDNDSECDQTVFVAKLHQKMSNKQMLITILCKTVANMTLIKLVVPDLVSKLLASTMSEGEDSHTNFTKLLKHNAKLQRSCLEYLSNIQDIVKNRELSLEIGSYIIQIISQANVDSQMYSVCVKCLLLVLPALLDNTSGCKDITVKLALVLQQQLCSMNWEQRDTTLELLSDLMIQYKENDGVASWIEENKMHHHAWQCKDDGESYVRATSIRCLYCFSTHTGLWTSLLSLVCLPEDKMIETIIDFLESDTEAFVRRSAASFLQRFYLDRVNNQSTIVCECIVKRMSKRIQDFDWEVKLHVLGFLNSVLNQELMIYPELSTLPKYAKTLLPNSDSKKSSQINGKNKLCLGLQKCHKLGCLHAVLAAVTDYDSKVSEKSVKVISSLRQKLKSSCEAIHVSEQELLDSLQDSLIEKVNVNGSTNFKAFQEPLESGDNQKSINDLTECVRIILSFDEEAHNGSCQDDSDYTKNPVSIIEDILSYGQKSDEDNVVDCY